MKKWKCNTWPFDLILSPDGTYIESKGISRLSVSYIEMIKRGQN